MHQSQSELEQQLSSFTYDPELRAYIPNVGFGEGPLAGDRLYRAGSTTILGDRRRRAQHAAWVSEGLRTLKFVRDFGLINAME